MINNNYLKIMSVVIAVFLWVMVALGQMETMTVSVPVKLVDAPSGFVALSSIPSVSVTVRGSAKIVNNMSYSSILLNVNVNSLAVGDSTRRILPQDIDTPLGVDVVEVFPRAITITMDQIATKNVRVVPAFIGEVATGYKVESASANPNSVIIEGAKSKLKSISTLVTLPVNISNIKESSVFNIGFKVEDGVKNIKPDSVEVRVIMKEDMGKRELKNVTVSCMDLKEGLSLKSSPKLSSVQLSGRVDLLDQFARSSVFIVNCGSITKPGKYSGTVVYQSDVEGIDVLSVTPQKINFEIH